MKGINCGAIGLVRLRIASISFSRTEYLTYFGGFGVKHVKKQVVLDNCRISGLVSEVSKSFPSFIFLLLYNFN